MAATRGPEDVPNACRPSKGGWRRSPSRLPRPVTASGDRDLADLTARVLANQRATDGVSVRIGHLEGRVTRLEGKVDAQGWT